MLLHYVYPLYVNLVPVHCNCRRYVKILHPHHDCRVCNKLLHHLLYEFRVYVVNIQIHLLIDYHLRNHPVQLRIKLVQARGELQLLIEVLHIQNNEIHLFDPSRERIHVRLPIVRSKCHFKNISPLP